jgi:lipopolysaccharide/colanic/teichoic acid biosynthesis glycosyltransferase
MAKRVFDLFVSLTSLILLSPMFVLIAIAIKLDSLGPVFFRGQRVGQDGHPLNIYKFRSMTVGAAQEGPGITAAGDSRVTRVGRILRRTKLDELPQLINVVRGEMSLVGPRPEDPRYVALYTKEQRRILSVRPGITSMASVKYRNEERILSQSDLDDAYVNKVMPEKLAIDLAYLDKQTFWRDLGVLALTFLALFR